MNRGGLFKGRTQKAGTRILLITFVMLALSSGTSRAQNFQILEATIDGVHAALTSGQITCHQLVDSYLDRIAAYDKQGPELNAIQHLNSGALERADELDAALETSGLVGPLHCVPVLLKDQVETSDMPTTYGSAVFSGFISGRDATIVTRMREAGAIILAKTNMGEYAQRFVGSSYGVTRNAYDPTRNPSGSSAGTGAGVAANFGLVGIGEDTGGSIRGPSAVHSLVGLRPTTPLVSRFGMMPAVPSNDTLGPITRTVSDAAILLNVIAGYDSNDPVTAYSVSRVPDSYLSLLDENGLDGARIGVIRQPMDPRTETDSEDYRGVQAVIDRAIEELRSRGAELIDPIEIPYLDLVDGTYVEDNFETEQAINDYLADLPNAPVTSLREILLSGKVNPWRASSLINVVGRSTQDAAYLEVLLTKEKIHRSVLNVMAEAEIDALVYATFDHQPTPIAPDVLTNPDPDDQYNWGNNRRLSPLISFPAITVPAGFTRDNLPVGLEFLGRPYSEGLLLQFAYAYEQATHHRRPPATTPELASAP